MSNLTLSTNTSLENIDNEEQYNALLREYSGQPDIMQFPKARTIKLVKTDTSGKALDDDAVLVKGGWMIEKSPEEIALEIETNGSGDASYRPKSYKMFAGAEGFTGTILIGTRQTLSSKFSNDANPHRYYTHEYDSKHLPVLLYLYERVDGKKVEVASVNPFYTTALKEFKREYRLKVKQFVYCLVTVDGKETVVKVALEGWSIFNKEYNGGYANFLKLNKDKQIQHFVTRFGSMKINYTVNGRKDVSYIADLELETPVEDTEHVKQEMTDLIKFLTEYDRKVHSPTPEETLEEDSFSPAEDDDIII